MIMWKCKNIQEWKYTNMHVKKYKFEKCFFRKRPYLNPAEQCFFQFS